MSNGILVVANQILLFVGVYKAEAHVFSLYLLIPYIGVTIPLLYYNWYVWCKEHLLPTKRQRFGSYEYGLKIDDDQYGPYDMGKDLISPTLEIL